MSWRAIFLLSVSFLVAAGCAWGRDGGNILSQTPLLVITKDGEPPVTAALDFSHDASRAACQASSDCILMQVGRCLNVQAIHKTQIEEANAWTEKAMLEYPDVVCAPGWPVENYEALCLNQHCRAALRNYRLLLEVPEQPVAGKPFWLGMSFRFNVNIGRVKAGFALPEDMQVVAGQPVWIGPVNALEDQVLWVQVQTQRVGDLYLHAYASVQDPDSGIPQLSMGEHFNVLEPSFELQPGSERILPTPTGQP